jgi:ATP-binding cassette subfamily F protein 3
VARTAKVRERRLERLLESEELIARPERRWDMALDFGDRRETGKDVAVLDSVGVELGGRPILRDVDLHVRQGERIAVTGANGAGKSTLVRLLAGMVAPCAGSIRLGSGVVVGHFAQEQETVDPRGTVLDQARSVAALSESDARSFLHRFLFAGDDVFRPAALLSYGERARLALALLVLRGATFLLLDEPLNHLDLPSRERFEAALAAFPGTSLFVLHDRYAVERLATRIVEIREGRIWERA